MRILVVEDDEVVQSAVARALRTDGHSVVTASELSVARGSVEEGVDLIVLDLRLPDGFGLTLCRELRQSGSRLPILVLTALSRVACRVEGLDAGADDFVAKPFAVAELRARVRALGRRGPRPRGLVVTFDDVVLDFGARSARARDQPVALTAREWTILQALARHPGQVVSHADILAEVWGEATEAVADTLVVLIGRLRRKLGNNAIRTVRSEGYALAEGTQRGP